MDNISFQESNLNYKGRNLALSYFIRPAGERAILYLHGLGSSKRDFIPIIEQKKFRDYTIVGLDFPGSGNSGYSAEIPLGMRELTEITGKFISQLKLNNLTVVGHSLGGLIALLLAAKHTEAIKKFVNVEGNLTPEDCILTREVVRLGYRDFIESDFLGKLKRKLAQSEFKGVKIYSDNFRREVTERAFYDYSLSIVDYSDNIDLLPLFTGLEIPHIFIYGSANGGLSYLPELRKRKTEVRKINNSHHWPLYDNPAMFYKVLFNFLER